MDIKVGEWIRLEDGRIRQLKWTDGENANWTRPYGEGTLKQIAKHSKNIIDLIETGDIVELEISEEFVEKEDKILFTRIGDVYTKELLQRDIENGVIVKIRTILTHKQYNQNCYKLR